ncbi:MAG: ABC transporter permease [Planctomycetota bacterium]
MDHREKKVMGSIWAVAANTIRQALRMRIAVVFIVMLLILLPVMGFSTVGDNTLKGRLQTFVSYGLSLTSFLLCLLTIIASVYSLTSDIKQMQIYTVITKPIRRSQLLLGKLLGVVLLSTALLAVFSAVIYAVVNYTPRFSKPSDDEIARAEKEFFTARAGLAPAEVDVTKEVLETYNRRERSGQLDQVSRGLSRREIIAQLTKLKKLEKRAAGIGQELVWEFNNVRPLDPGQSLFVRFKCDVSVTPPDGQIYGQWFVGDNRQVYEGRNETPIAGFERKDSVRTFHEIEVPADVVAKDGYLGVGFRNVPLNNTVVIFPLEDGLEVLYKADTFTANFIRAVLLILLRLIFLAVLGILASTFLSFPVAILLCLVVFLTGTVSGFVLESFDVLSENVGAFYSYTFRPIIQLLPQFDRFNPTRYLVSARLLSWALLARVAGIMIGIKAVLLMGLALLIFRRREIAKITV